MKKILIFNILLILLLSFITTFINQGLKKSGLDNFFPEWNDIINGKAGADIIIQGSSKAMVQISPKIMEQDLGLSVYNLGINGYNFHMQKMRYELYKKYNKKPKIIIQIVDVFSLQKRKDLFMYQQFYPYYNEKLVIDAIKTYKGFQKLRYYIPFIKYAGQSNYVKVGILESLGISHIKSNKYKGYEEHSQSWDTSFEKFKKDNPNGINTKLDLETIKLFEEFLKESNASNIEIFLIYPPEYYEAKKYLKDEKKIIEIYKYFSKKYRINFYDFSKDDMCKSKKYFYNSQHLNKTGAELFTKKIVDILKNIKHIPTVKN